MLARKLGFACVVIAGGVMALAAQAPTPTFDVVSIKRNESGSFPVGPEARPGGAFIATNTTLASLLRFAYRLPDYLLAGGPGWIRTDRFDVEARAGREVSPAEIEQMVQALLQRRFQLVAHREQREMPLYTLVIAGNEKRLGPGLRPSAAGCAQPGGRGATMDERRSPNGGVATRRSCAPIAALVSSLSAATQSPVDDKTGLSGLWDYELSFTGERRRNAAPAPAAADPSDAPVLFTAVQEQLGLRLEPRRGPVEVLMIESAAQPTEN